MKIQRRGGRKENLVIDGGKMWGGSTLGKKISGENKKDTLVKRGRDQKKKGERREKGQNFSAAYGERSNCKADSERGEKGGGPKAG